MQTPKLTAMKKELTAAEAKNIADTNRGELREAERRLAAEKEELRYILSHVNVRATDGYYHFSYSKVASFRVRKWLEDLGYSVSYSSIVGKNTNIHWDK